MVDQDLHELDIGVVLGFLAILEGVVRMLEHRDHLLMEVLVEEKTYLLRKVILFQCLPSHGVADHVDPLLDDGGLTVVHPCCEHVLLGDVHRHWLGHHPSDAVRLAHQPVVLLVPRVDVGR